MGVLLSSSSSQIGSFPEQRVTPEDFAAAKRLYYVRVETTIVSGVYLLYRYTREVPTRNIRYTKYNTP
jgi:hypothetical protein